MHAMAAAVTWNQQCRVPVIHWTWLMISAACIRENWFAFYLYPFYAWKSSDIKTDIHHRSVAEVIGYTFLSSHVACSLQEASDLHSKYKKGDRQLDYNNKGGKRAIPYIAQMAGANSSSKVITTETRHQTCLRISRKKYLVLTCSLQLCWYLRSLHLH